MLALGGFVVVLSGYVSFAARREGASFQRALLGGALSAAVLQSIVTCGTVWLEGVAIIELAMTIWAGGGLGLRSLGGWSLRKTGAYRALVVFRGSGSTKNQAARGGLAISAFRWRCLAACLSRRHGRAE